MSGVSLVPRRFRSRAFDEPKVAVAPEVPIDAIEREVVVREKAHAKCQAEFETASERKIVADRKRIEALETFGEKSAEYVTARNESLTASDALELAAAKAKKSAAFLGEAVRDLKRLREASEQRRAEEVFNGAVAKKEQTAVARREALLTYLQAIENDFGADGPLESCGVRGLRVIERHVNARVAHYAELANVPKYRRLSMLVLS